jgi:hypothetical protein
METWAKIVEDCFDPKQPDIGSYNSKFAVTWAKVVDANFGSDGSKLLKMDQMEFSKIASDLNAKMRKDMGKNQTAKQNLTEFSMWLARFERSDHAESDVELPGKKNPYFFFAVNIPRKKLT